MLTSALLCLSLAVYHESRNQPVPTQNAVVSVIKNRAAKEHKTPCQILYAKNQFSFVRGRHIPAVTEKATFQKIKKRVLTHRVNLSRKYIYFNSIRLGKRFATKAKPIKLASLLFY